MAVVLEASVTSPTATTTTSDAASAASDVGGAMVTSPDAIASAAIGVGGGGGPNSVPHSHTSTVSTSASLGRSAGSLSACHGLYSMDKTRCSGRASPFHCG